LFTSVEVAYGACGHDNGDVWFDGDDIEGFNNRLGDRVPDVSADIRALMESMGGAVEIDEYR
jgi:hypothetical protein